METYNKAPDPIEYIPPTTHTVIMYASVKEGPVVYPGTFTVQIYGETREAAIENLQRIFQNLINAG